MRHAELLIDGTFVGGPCDQSVAKAIVRDPYRDKRIGTVAEGHLSELRAAIEAAQSAFPLWRRSPRYERQALLRNIARLVRERQDELVEILSLEVGKPIVWSRGEVARLALTFDFAADALATFGVEAAATDLDPRGAGYEARVERFPRGVIFGIVPYNWPFNLAAHKVAPALATGNTIVLKTSSQAALSTLTLARLIHDAGCPPGVVNAWNGPSEVAQRVLAEDARIRMLSFTGSPAVGWKLKSLLSDRMVTLELGGDAAAIVHHDCDMDWAVRRIVAGGYGYAGQVCIAVQHVRVHESIVADFRERLIGATRECPYGDPMEERTVCGPLISSEAADRVEAWIEEAIAGGAEALVRGRRSGNVIAPTLLERVPENCRLANEEVFGPVLTLSTFGDIDEVLGQINTSRYGIHTGIFTRDLRLARKAFDTLEVGGVVVDDYPTLRFDHLPYGGTKSSGFGREGVRFAMEEMTEPRSLVIRNRD
jgi:acyl-CoA reductase-like NAD-dependent aldehyde dehydrogenase